MDQEVRDIYKLDKQMSRVWKQIKAELSPNNFGLMEKYDTTMVNVGIAKSTRIKHIKVLLSLTRKLNKDWSDASKEDIDRLVRGVMDEYGDINGDETESSRDFKKILKIFFRWLKLGSRDHKQVGDPPQTKDIRLRKPKDKITRENLLDDDDRTKLLHACGENLRDRAFIDVHLEAGTRPGEILSLQIKHVEFDSVGARIHVDGKTGARPIRLITSVPNLASWINAHPYGKNPESPLWILLDNRNYGKPLSYVAAKALVQRRCKMANLSKRVNLNLFRHTAATSMSKILMDSEMKKRHGWTRTSNMPARYVHLVDSDVDEKILKYHGIKPEETKSQNLPKTCFVCKRQNPSDFRWCSQCGKALDIKTAIETDEKHKAEKEEIKAMLEDARKDFTAQINELKYGMPARESFFNNIVIEGKRLDNRVLVVIARLFQWTFEYSADEETKKKRWAEYLDAKEKGKTINLEKMLKLKPRPLNDELKQKLSQTIFDLPSPLVP